MIDWRCANRWPSFQGSDRVLRELMTPKSTWEAFSSPGRHGGALPPSSNSVALASTTSAVAAETIVVWSSGGNWPQASPTSPRCPASAVLPERCVLRRSPLARDATPAMHVLALPSLKLLRRHPAAGCPLASVYALSHGRSRKIASPRSTKPLSPLDAAVR